MKIKSFAQAKAKDLENIQGVCLDIDDTLTTHGQLTAQAYQALWKLKEANLAVIPITGRPAGHCDHIARFWPVDAVVGENGAFVFYLHQGKLHYYTPMPPDFLRRNKKQIEELKQKVRAQFPQVQWASDQDYRLFDLAVDYCEDVPAWSEGQIQELLTFFQQQKVGHKQSSIHINAWYGEYDKQTTFSNWLREIGDEILGKKIALDEWIFIGDSPNDAPAFGYFPKQVGVANIKEYLPQMSAVPRWITENERGAGFSEFVEILLAAKNNR